MAISTFACQCIESKAQTSAQRTMSHMCKLALALLAEVLVPEIKTMEDGSGGISILEKFNCLVSREWFDFRNIVATMATAGETMQVGIRDLKNKLTHYLEIAKSGHAVIIMDRGAPVAVLHNLDQIEENAGYEERLVHLAVQGFLTMPKTLEERVFPTVKRAEAKGEAVSETILRERR